MKVHILTKGFEKPNTRALYYPLVLFNKYLSENGVKWKIYKKIDTSIYECDCLIVDSNYHGKRWLNEKELIIEELSNFNNKIKVLHYFDMSDSTALLHPEVLPYVSGYYKLQKLNDVNEYSNSHYGNRLFTHFVNFNYGVEDVSPSNSNVVSDAGLLKKIHVFWNSGFSNYTFFGKYLNSLYQILPLSNLLRYPIKFCPVDKLRNNDITCRINTNYHRNTVAWFRKTAKNILKSRIKTNKLKSYEYFKELEDSKLTISPFAWGEINYKDYEAFISGSLLIKPDMSHLSTWPDYYLNNKTYLSYKWDCSDLLDVIDDALDNYQERKEIAVYAQEKYKQMLFSEDGIEEFVNRFNNIVLNKVN